MVDNTLETRSNKTCVCLRFRLFWRRRFT